MDLTGLRGLGFRVWGFGFGVQGLEFGGVGWSRPPPPPPPPPPPAGVWGLGAPRVHNTTPRPPTRNPKPETQNRPPSVKPSALKTHPKPEQVGNPIPTWGFPKLGGVRVEGSGFRGTLLGP